MYNKKLYNKIMRKISHVVRQKLNENVFTDGRYDRWVTSTPYDDEEDIEGIISVDIIDTLNCVVVDDDELERLLNVCKKSGITEDTIVQVVTDGSDIIADEQLQELLSHIQSPRIRETIENYVYEQIEKDIENGDYDYGQNDADYRVGQRDSYMDSLRKKHLGEKINFRR